MADFGRGGLRALAAPLRGALAVAWALSNAACTSENSSGTPGFADASASGGQASGTGGSNGSGGASTGGSATGSGGASGGAAGNDGGGGLPSATGGSAGTDSGSVPDFPNATTTGPHLDRCAGGALVKYTGDDPFRPNTGDEVSCMEFDDVSIYVAQDVSNVTIRDCLFQTTVDLFVNVQGSHVTVEDSRFVGPAGTWIRNSYAGDHLTVLRNDFSGMANAVEFNVGFEDLEGNYVHDFGNVDPSQHADGLQTDGSSHIVVCNNTVLLNDVDGATGAISIMGDSGDDVLVEHNQVGGGGYTIYPGGANYTNVRFLDNCFSTTFYPGKAQTGAYGPWYPSQNPPGLVRTGNTWCDGPDAGRALDDNP